MASLSIRAYAKHRGVSDAAVRRAIDDKRITLLPDGQIDPEIADKEWDENTDKRFQPKPAASPVPEPSTGISLQKSRANKELFEALLKKLEYEEKSGKLVDRAKVEMEAFAAARVARDRLLLIPDRVAPIIIGETDMFEIKRVLREEIIRSLQNLTDFLHGGTGSG
ncbi:MAG: elements of external origin [Alphaproteobacteria bacterium]|nr:elements of external origin [Alphaproteobacteria bacterium]